MDTRLGYRHVRQIATLILILLLVAGCGSAATPAPTPVPTAPPTATQPPPTPSSATAQDKPTSAASTPELAATKDDATAAAAADKTLKQWTKIGTFSGSVLIARNGHVLLRQGYGFADRDKNISNGPSTKYRIGETTEAFTAIAILLLQAQGKLKVQDSVCTYLKDCPAVWKTITLNQLLIHSSGIPAEKVTGAADEMLKEAQILPLDFTPGSQFGFSHNNFNLLGRIIEVASGQTYDAFVKSRILDPVQMADSGYDQGQKDLAVDYYNDLKASVTEQTDQFAAAGLFSTVDDLYRLDQALDGETLLSHMDVNTMMAGYIDMPDSGGACKIGYGVYVCPGSMLVEASGGYFVPGARSVIHRFAKPSNRVTIIILSNQADVVPWAYADQLANMMFGFS